ncbi:MAG: T9SS type A sorting domain-containing protein [Bacteroidales bacterium]|nr:T9SS type A sorting domain-containing protein [Bacteroidales bacterium]
MKRIFAFFAFLSIYGWLCAQVATVPSSGMEQARVVFTTPSMSVDTQRVDGTLYSQLRMADFANVGTVGEPMLPVYSRTIEIPLCTAVQVEVVASQKQTVSASSLGIEWPLMPQQPARRKSDTSAAVFVRNAEVYATDAFCGSPVVEVHRMGVSRDRNLAVISFSPVRYNPATGMVELYSQVEVVLHYVDADLSATREMQRRYHSDAFAPQTDLLLSQPTAKLDNATSAPVRYLIVCHSSFRGRMDTFVEWKRRKGFLTDIVYTDESEVGTSNTSIAAYIKSQYTNATDDKPAPTYLLLVGDVDQIPAFNASNQVDNDHVTDLYYATWTDGDFLPDCYYGRFSAQTVEQLAPQVNKTLLYEQYGFSDPTYLSRAILIAGVDGGYSSDNAYRYGDPAMDYCAKTYINAANGYSTVIYYKNNTSFAPTGVTVTGSSNASGTSDSLRRQYNLGAGWVNYTAHGSETSWATPSLTVSNAEGLLNYGKPMFMIGNCCLTNHFNTSTCFGEALMRRGNNAGAVAYIGGSNSTYWEQDFCWAVGVRSNISNTMNTSYDASRLGSYDLLFHTHGESGPSWRTSAGAIISAGNMAVQNINASSSYVKYYWEIYHVMGDPSLEPWLGQAGEMPLAVNGSYLRGSAPLSVTAVPYAYVALTDGNGTLVAATFANAQGAAQLNIPSTTPLGSYELAVTAQNYKPEFRTVRIISPTGAALSVIDLTADAPLVAGDTVTFTVRVTNLSDAVPSSAFSMECSSTDLTQLLIIDGDESFSAVSPLDTLVGAAAFRAVVSPTATDGARVMVNLHMIEGTDTSLFSTYVNVLAPRPVVARATLSPEVEPGETSTLTVTVRNDGHAPVVGATVSLQHPYSTATVLTVPYTGLAIAPGDSVTVTFDIAFAQNLVPSAGIPFLFEMNHEGGVFSQTLSFSYAHVMVVDYETGDLTQIMNSMNSHPWVIDTLEVYEDRYAIRSSRSLGHMSSSKMSLTYTSDFADSIRFYAKVSSESNGDWFTFSIDGQEMLTLSGEIDWTRYAFPLPAGEHTFVFKYQKNWWRSSGSDAVWVDNIILPASILPTVYLSDTVCQHSQYTFFGEPVGTDMVGTEHYEHTSSTEITYLSLTVLEAPGVTIAASSSEVRAGSAVLLVASGANRYEWNTGATGPQIQVTPTVTTDYSVVGYQGTCSASAAITIRVTNAIDETETQAVRLYPNPASDRFVVEAAGLRRVTVYDVTGRQMMVQESCAETQEIATKEWPGGVYFVRVETREATCYQRVVLQ